MRVDLDGPVARGMLPGAAGPPRRVDGDLQPGAAGPGPGATMPAAEIPANALVVLVGP
jgi:hypothetical protein